MSPPVPLNIADTPERELVTASGERLSCARSLSAPFGLEGLLVHQEVLPPGRRASGLHFHSHKEELFYVLVGHPSVWTGAEFVDLAPGDFIGFPPSPDAPHLLVNRSDAPATILTIGTRPPDDQITFLPLPDPA
ncbi:cupin domain-containing protein [Deinococcus aluminii]|uniref:Cupin type-2 domain-containing protein n=1 Tax=Deinococcus aluminii TaxID=1656885 RepID=A0ABP9XDN8_9DEIO